MQHDNIVEVLRFWKPQLWERRFLLMQISVVNHTIPSFSSFFHSICPGHDWMCDAHQRYKERRTWRWYCWYYTPNPIPQTFQQYYLNNLKWRVLCTLGRMIIWVPAWRSGSNMFYMHNLLFCNRSHALRLVNTCI